MDKWILYSLISVVSISIMTLLFKHLLNTGLNPEIINFYFFLISTIAFLGFLFTKSSNFQVPSSSIPVFIILGLLALSYNYFDLLAIKSAPNPGYVEAILTLKIVIVTFLSFWLFSSELNTTKLIGVGLCVLGGFLLRK